jgi:Uma2 family endonuclease
MAIAHAPHAALESEEDVPRPRTLEEIHDTLDIPGCRIEILGGRIVVSPSPAKLHGRIVTWLTRVMGPACEDRGWDCLGEVTIDLPATRERIEPDLLICPVNESTDREWLIPASEAVLVAEVVSPSSRYDDYETKRKACALSGVPLYLVIDPDTPSLTLFTQPGDGGYSQATPIPAGGRLALPAPIEITLDTTTMPVGKRRL